MALFAIFSFADGPFSIRVLKLIYKLPLTPLQQGMVTNRIINMSGMMRGLKPTLCSFTLPVTSLRFNMNHYAFMLAIQDYKSACRTRLKHWAGLYRGEATELHRNFDSSSQMLSYFCVWTRIWLGSCPNWNVMSGSVFSSWTSWPSLWLFQMPFVFMQIMGRIEFTIRTASRYRKVKFYHSCQRLRNV